MVFDAPGLNAAPVNGRYCLTVGVEVTIAVVGIAGCHKLRTVAPDARVPEEEEEDDDDDDDEAELLLLLDVVEEEVTACLFSTGDPTAAAIAVKARTRQCPHFMLERRGPREKEDQNCCSECSQLPDCRPINLHSTCGLRLKKLSASRARLCNCFPK